MDQIINTDFLSRVLATISSVAPENLIQHVGSVDSWPALLFTGENAAMIFNTQFEEQPGEHWVAVYIDGTTQEAFIFDSMPVEPFPQTIRSRLSMMGTTIRNTNSDNIILQNPLYPLCGIYCLAFLERAINGQSLNLCINNLVQNDITVLSIVWPFIGKTFFE